MRAVLLLVLITMTGAQIASSQAAGSPQRTRNYAASPAVSPDGRRVAFLSDRDGAQDIYVSDIDGSNVQRLTNSSTIEIAPRWNRGNRIAYVEIGRDSARTNTLVSINPDGSDARVYVRGPGLNGPDLSPDSKSLLYTGPGESRLRNRVYVMNVDGSGTRAVSSGFTYALNPSWSADGNTIVFVERDTTSRAPTIVLTGSDGVALRRVSQIPMFAAWPQLSPDGRTIVFMSNDTRAHDARVFTVGADGNDLRQIESHDRAYLDEMPGWFPNGGRIIFHSDRSGRFELYSIKPDGKNLSRLTK